MAFTHVFLCTWKTLLCLPTTKICELERHLCHQASVDPLLLWIWILDALQNHLEGFLKRPTAGPFHRDLRAQGPASALTTLHTQMCEPQGQACPPLRPRPPQPAAFSCPTQPASVAPGRPRSPGAGRPLASSAARGRADPRSCHLPLPRRPFTCCPCTHPSMRTTTTFPDVNRTKAPERGSDSSLFWAQGSPLLVAVKFGLTAEPPGDAG